MGKIRVCYVPSYFIRDGKIKEVLARPHHSHFITAGDITDGKKFQCHISEWVEPLWVQRDDMVVTKGGVIYGVTGIYWDRSSGYMCRLATLGTRYNNKMKSTVQSMNGKGLNSTLTLTGLAELELI